jgi:single-strand DNA-binding protein
MLNRVVLIGRLTKDPEMRYTPQGAAVTNFTLAVDRQFKNAQGEREADFIMIVCWRQLAELVSNYMRKGRLAAVEGRIQTRNYENNEGKRVYITEVVADNVQFLDKDPNREQGGSYAGTGGGYNNNTSGFGGANGGGMNAGGSASSNNYGSPNSNFGGAPNTGYNAASGQGNNNNYAAKNNSTNFSGSNWNVGGSGYGASSNNSSTDSFKTDGSPIDISDDDLPF